MSRRPISLARLLAVLACAAPLLAPTPAPADTCAGLSLGLLTPGTPVGNTPTAVAVGDFNRDGKLDAAVANGGGDNVIILLGNGTGGFSPGSTVSTGATSNPIDLVAGDLDKDGILDLVVAYGSSSQVRVLRGLAGGGFSALTQFNVADQPARLYLADFSRDGNLDLVVVSSTGNRVRLFEGNGGLGFPAVLATIDEAAPGPPETPSAAAVADYNRDGKLDLAVAYRGSLNDDVRLYFGNGIPLFAWTAGPSAIVGATDPQDIAAGDVDRDGWPDLVTANSASGDALVLRNNAGVVLEQSTAPLGGTPRRVALVDLDHDAILDIVAVDDSATRSIVGVRGLKTGPPFFQSTPLYPTSVPGTPAGLGVGRFTADGRADVVTTLAGAPGQAIVLENRSGTPCAGTSFARAPRAYAAGLGPAATTAADFDGDGRTDIAVAAQSDRTILLLRNVGGHLTDFAPPTVIPVSPAMPVAVATADLDSDGKADVVAAMSGPDRVQVFRGNGIGGLTPGDFEPIGSAPSAVVTGDFDGNGFPDVAATSEGMSFVYVYLGDGLGGLTPLLPTGTGAAPRALVAGHFNADGFLDLAVANSATNDVTILLGTGSGSFNLPLTVPVGSSPAGIAAADIDGDADIDLVAANNVSGTVSVLRNDGSGVFTVVATLAVPPNPTAVALVDVAGDPAPDIAVTSGGNRALTVLTNTGGTFGSPSDHSVRTFPRAITPADIDADGRLDLVVPCQNAHSVVVLLARPPGPPPLLDAPRVVVGDRPVAVAATDLDGDGDLDLAVANQGVKTVADDTLSLLRNNGNETFTLYASPSVGQDPESIVAGDFNRDGRVDLALNAAGATPALSIFFGSTTVAGQLDPQLPQLIPGAVPDDLAAGDFDLDGDLDIAVCDKQIAGSVRIVTNNGAGVFSLGPTIAGVGNAPTAVVAVDLDRDGYLDLAVANDDSDDVRILMNDRVGGFTLGASLPLPAVSSPVSLAAADFDADGIADLAVATFSDGRLFVFRNQGAGTFDSAVPFDAPATLQFVMAADVNRDGKPDLAAIATGLVALRGKGALDFERPETWVAGQLPVAGAVADLNGDGRPDAVVVNEGSDDVSLLLSTTCLPRRLEVTLQPVTCDPVGPYFQDVVVETRDEGGNLAVCSGGTAVVRPTIAPGTGAAGAVLGPPAVLSGIPLTNGAAAFTGANALSIDRAGRRYRLQFTLDDVPAPNVPPALSRPFTLGPGPIQIAGPSSFCAGGSALYGAVGEPPNLWDDYRWTLGAAPAAFTPTVRLQNPPLALGSHTLGLTTRIDGCSATATPRALFVGDLQSVTLDLQGISTVCVNCIGGSAKAVEVGGGTPARQWGYRTTPGPNPITPLPSETGDIYVLKGASFPGPGTYYVVVTSTSACAPTTRISNEWAVTVVDSVPSGEVKHLAASSRGSGVVGGVNRLFWVNTTGTVDEVRIRWNKAPDGTTACLPPANPTVLPVTGEASILSPVPMMGDFPQPGLVFDTAYCYSVFVRVGANWSAGRTVKARPFNADAPNPVKWAYATGGTAVTPPTVSGPAILAMSNDRTVHALTRTATGGEWPAGWVPTSLAGVAHSRSPVVPFLAPLNGADNVLFAADDSGPGYVHAINARTGGSAWVGGAQPQAKPVTGAPGGMFTEWFGTRNLLFVGTRDNTNPNELRALALADGALVQAYTGFPLPGQPIGAISGTPSIDTATRRVYFASRQHLASGPTLWCLQISDPPTTPVLSHVWSVDLGNITGSPVLRGGRVYVGTDAGLVYSLDAATGLDPHTFAPADGPVKGFLFPDRRIGSDDLVFATNTRVWSISDDGTGMTRNWDWTNSTWTNPLPADLNPSLILHWPQTNFVYVGSRNGELYELDFTFANASTPPTSRRVVLGGGQGQVGAPSLDIGGAGPRKLLLVGSEPGVLYAVEVELP